MRLWILEREFESEGLLDGGARLRDGSREFARFAASNLIGLLVPKSEQHSLSIINNNIHLINSSPDR